MPTTAHVPDELRTTPFLGRMAVEQGLLSKAQLRSSIWTSPLRGIYLQDAPLDAAVRWEILALRRQPHDVVAGRTAAWAYGAWTPLPGRLVPWEVTSTLTGSGRNPVAVNRRRLTLRGGPDWAGTTYGISMLDHDVVECGGVPVLSPLRTCFDLMRERGLVESVVVADAFMWGDVVDPTALAIYVTDRRRWPNIRQARVALALSHPAARSPGESRLRMVVVLAGLPEPLVNVPVIDQRDLVLGIPDLTVLGRRRVGLEYDGAYHDDEEQQGKDRRRENSLTALSGLPLLRYDRVAVRSDRRVILAEVSGMSGLTPTTDLDDADFRRPPPARSW